MVRARITAVRRREMVRTAETTPPTRRLAPSPTTRMPPGRPEPNRRPGWATNASDQVRSANEKSMDQWREAGPALSPAAPPPPPLGAAAVGEGGGPLRPGGPPPRGGGGDDRGNAQVPPPPAGERVAAFVGGEDAPAPPVHRLVDGDGVDVGRI